MAEVGSQEACPIAFWLIPAQPHLGAFRVLISALAREYDAPGFEPHITLHVGVRAAREDIVKLLQWVAKASNPITLVAGKTSQSDALFKTLFVEFEDPGIRILHRQFQAGLQHFSEYALAPHLSLLYKAMPEESRAVLAERHGYAGRRIVFDAVAAVRPAPGQPDWSDIQMWDSSLRQSLCSTQDQFESTVPPPLKADTRADNNG